ncbi:unnamed protein product [Cunninghamella echinulata]
MIEMYPPTFKLFLADIPSQGFVSTVEKSPSITLSRKTTIKNLKQTLLNAFDLSMDKTFTLWQLDSNTQSHIGSSPIISTSALQDANEINMDDENKTISNLSLNSSNLVIDLRTAKQREEDEKTKSSNVSLDTKNLNINSATSAYNDSSSFGPIWSKNTSASRQKGVCGLNNLGNTCFMNSALQCLSNTELLTEWFLAGNYKKELNRDNPLGMGGQVAENYGALIEKLWSGTNGTVAPRDFKYTISRFNPTFTGYQQHDSQELLAFLLDGLHEDLNRILKKPYIEMPDFDDMTDEEIAKTSWDYHKARNDSIIVDLFQGQFKSRLVCNVCKKISVTFDPFMYLSLPLPVQKNVKQEIVYVPYDPSQPPQRMIITIDKDASIKKFKSVIANQVGAEDSNKLLVVEIFSNKFYKVFPDYEPIGTIRRSDIIYIYQLPGPLPSPSPQRQSRFNFRNRLSVFNNSANDDKDEEEEFDGEKWIVFPVYCATSPENDNSYQTYEQFGGPMLLAIQAKDATSPENIYKLIAKHVERYTIMKLFEEVRNPTEVTTTTTTPLPLSNNNNDNNNNDDDIELKEVEDNYMEVDNVSKPIKTAAAVTAAGGRQLVPISNLFSMKLFSENSYSSDGPELIPTHVNSWRVGQVEDLRERANKENEQRIAYEKAQKKDNGIDDMVTSYDSQKFKNKNNFIDDDDDDTIDDLLESNIKVSNEPMDSIATEKPDTIADDYENDIVNDVETEWNKDISMDVSLDDTRSNKSDNSSMIVEASGQNKYLDSSPPSPSPPTSSSSLFLPSTQPALPLRCPPRTVIRQGEGIIIDWRLKKAQELFGVSKSSLSTSSLSSLSKLDINEDAWKDIEDLGDPNAELNKKERNKQITLMDCLNEFTKEEQLSEEDLWYCPKCKEHQRATKKFDIWHLPEIMVVHLKRFSHTRTLRDKLDIFIDFPMESLDMTDHVLSIKNESELAEKDRLIYDLYAVDNHFGGLGGGHYTAYAQNCQDGFWYNFDDSHVSKVQSTEAKTSAAYLLFYKRRRNLEKDEQPIIEKTKESEL